MAEANRYETLQIEVTDKVATVMFNRPEKKNAMNPQLHRDMTAALDELRYRKDVVVLVITGAGDTFSAGMDLKEFFHELRNDNPSEYDRITNMAIEWRGRTLRYYPKPTIAMVNGSCFGGAFSIVESCDLAIAADDARFGLSEINFKLFPGGCVSKSLANMFHSRDALLYAMSGRTFDGRMAARMRFVNFSVPKGDLLRETMNLAHEIAAKDPAALKGCKDGYRFSLEMSWEASMNFTAAKASEIQLQQEGENWLKEGIGDFVGGKYKPGLGGHEMVKSK